MSNEIYTDINVLLVEDDEKTIEEFLPFLQRYFINIDIAVDGKEGLEKSQKKKYDIIITDIVMPKIDGIEMIKKIKCENKNSKFIIITAHSNKEFLIKLIELGVQAYLIKPITFRQLAKTIKRVTDEIYKERKLISQMEEITKLAETKSEFLANMSHEIRTPLNAIVGLIRVMKEEDSGKFKKYLDIIDSSSQTLLTIINDILDLSKLEAEKMSIEKINFHSDELFYTAELFEEKAREKNIDYKIKFRNVPEYLYGDVHRIKQVLSNLISNAIKFTPENKKIDIMVEYKDEKLFVEVKDEGIGIPQEKLSIIFDAFSQADSSITRQFGGTGLGLTISYKLIKMLGGELKVESKVGKGSRFYFEIPLQMGIEQKDRIDNSKIENSKIKLLVAEDNKANQMFMEILLKKMNIDYDIANNGEEVVQLFENDNYDIILMDINMPLISGIEATQIIREKNKTIPIIALTAAVLDDEERKYLNAGMNDVLEKPLNIENLKIILNKYLNDKTVSK